MKYIASCSFGKDSLATVLMAPEYGEPLDEVLYCEVMFDENISGEVPEHKDFIYERAIPAIKAAGIKVTVIQSPKTFVGLFNKRIASGPNTGKIWSWPLCGRCYIQRDCKTRPLQAYKRGLGEITQYIGIANDEDTRIARLDGKTSFPSSQSTRLTKPRPGRYAPAVASSPRFMTLPLGTAAFSAQMQNARNSATSTITTRSYGKDF